MKFEVELNSLPFPEKDARHYISKIQENFEAFVKYFDKALFVGLMRNDDNVVIRGERNVVALWNYIVGKAYDNANDIGMVALSNGEVNQSNWEEYADTFVGASVEGIILEVINN